MKRFLVYEESSEKSSYDKHMRSISCEYEFILYACIMPMLMLYQGIHQQSENSVVCGMLRQAWIRH